MSELVLLDSPLAGQIVFVLTEVLESSELPKQRPSGETGKPRPNVKESGYG